MSEWEKFTRVQKGTFWVWFNAPVSFDAMYSQPDGTLQGGVYEVDILVVAVS